jgi:hypothetical protein
LTAPTPSAPPDPGTVPRLAFSVLGAARAEYTAVPTLRFELRIDTDEGRQVRSVLLDVQVQIAARRRPYDDSVKDRLFELFGPASDWGTTLRTLLWTRATLVVPPFTGTTSVELPITCTYDLEVAASRYFAALEDGEVPLEFLFSGSIFYSSPEGRLQTARISWEEDADYRLPVRVWRETMDRHFPGTAWIRLQREAFDRLATYKSRNAIATWEEAVDRLLPEEEVQRPWTP